MTGTNANDDGASQKQEKEDLEVGMPSETSSSAKDFLNNARRENASGSADASDSDADAADALKEHGQHRGEGREQRDSHLKKQRRKHKGTKLSPVNQDGMVREQVARVRDADEALPMGKYARKRLQIRSKLMCFASADSKDGAESSQNFEKPSTEDSKSENLSNPKKDEKKAKQYTLKSRRSLSKDGYLQSCWKWFKAVVGYENVRDAGGYVNKMIVTYLNWSFRASFMAAFFSMLILYLEWILIFAGLFMGAGILSPDCLYVGSTRGYSRSAHGAFGDVFLLSWTTFSTVGFGAISPATSVNQPNQGQCVFTQFLSTLEAFLGLLYAGFCGAILFAKVTRTQKNANIVFSDPMCIRYGPGLEVFNGVDDNVEGELEDNDEFDDDITEVGSHADKAERGEEFLNRLRIATYQTRVRADKIPCPVLEFRIVNERCNHSDGAIMKATLACMTSVVCDVNSKGDIISRVSGSIHKHQYMHHGQNADGSSGRETRGKVSAKRLLQTVELETSSHPFFQRVWNARHRLDDCSPFLRGRVKRSIRANGGYWPEELNSAECIRKSLRFGHLVVSFSGTSEITAGDVYAQKIYDFVDVNVGYQFAPILYRNIESDELGVDISMINDVLEQNGGGGMKCIMD